MNGYVWVESKLIFAELLKRTERESTDEMMMILQFYTVLHDDDVFWQWK